MNAVDEKRYKGIYLLPNLFTTAGLFAGFYAVTSAMSGRFEAAAIAIFVAMIMDGIDGRLARMTHTESDFGKEYDSLADMVSFGLAPALVMYQWALAPLGKVGFAGAFMFAAAAALRLARFNTQAGIVDKGYFQGLASPAAAALIAGMVWWGDVAQWPRHELAGAAFMLTVIAGVLMVSNIRYFSFKSADLKGRVPFIRILFVVGVFGLVAMDPPRVLFTVALLYALSGPVLTVAQLRYRRAGRKTHNRDDQS